MNASLPKSLHLPGLTIPLTLTAACAIALGAWSLGSRSPGPAPDALTPGVGEFADGHVILLANGHREVVGRHTRARTSVRDIDMSHDGSTVVWTRGSCTGGPREIVTMRGTGSTPAAVEGSSRFAPAQLDWNSTSTRFVFVNASSGQIYTMGSNGSDARRIAIPGQSARPTWSQDGHHILYLHRGSQADPWQIWTMRSDGSGQRQVTSGPASYEDPVWAPDGSAVAAGRDGRVVIMRPDGSGERALTPASSVATSPAFSPDGAIVAWSMARANGMGHVIAMRDMRGGKVVILTPDHRSDVDPRFTSSGAGIVVASTLVHGAAATSHHHVHFDGAGTSHATPPTTSSVPACASP